MNPILRAAFLSIGATFMGVFLALVVIFVGHGVFRALVVIFVGH